MNCCNCRRGVERLEGEIGAIEEEKGLVGSSGRHGSRGDLRLGVSMGVVWKVLALRIKIVVVAEVVTKTLHSE